MKKKKPVWSGGGVYMKDGMTAVVAVAVAAETDADDGDDEDDCLRLRLNFCSVSLSK